MKLTRFEVKKMLLQLRRQGEMTTKEAIEFVRRNFNKHITFSDVKLAFWNCSGDIWIRYRPADDTWVWPPEEKNKRIDEALDKSGMF